MDVRPLSHEQSEPLILCHEYAANCPRTSRVIQVTSSLSVRCAYIYLLLARRSTHYVPCLRGASKRSSSQNSLSFACSGQHKTPLCSSPFMSQSERERPSRIANNVHVTYWYMYSLLSKAFVHVVLLWCCSGVELRRFLLEQQTWQYLLRKLSFQSKLLSVRLFLWWTQRTQIFWVLSPENAELLI